MKMRVFIAALALTVASCDYGQATVDQGLSQRLKQPVKESQLTASNRLQALFRLAAEYRIPLGIVWVDGPASDTPIDISVRGMNVAEALRSVVSGMPEEELFVGGPIVHIFSNHINARAPWLFIRFREYDAENDLTSMVGFHLRQAIQARQIEDGRRNSKQPLSGCGGHITLGRGDRRISFHLVNPTVEQILDTIVEKSGLNIWIVTLPQDDRDGLDNSRSLWSSSAIPEKDQPYWDLLAWGVDPKSGGFHNEWLTFEGNDYTP